MQESQNFEKQSLWENLRPQKNFQKARAYFPRGLIQPEHGFKAGLDALLLAAFSIQKKQSKILDLGCGCGMAGLALILCSANKLEVTGLDNDPEMVYAAQNNAGILGFDPGNRQFEENRSSARSKAGPGETDSSFTAILADLNQIKEEKKIAPESFDLVISNPPYRTIKTGRLCPEPQKNPARFEVKSSLRSFINAAAFAVKNRGKVSLICLVERLDTVLATLQQTRLRPKIILPVQSRPDKEASLVLIEAVKNAGEGLRLLPSLILYRNASLTKEALDFCPFLETGKI